MITKYLAKFSVVLPKFCDRCGVAFIDVAFMDFSLFCRKCHRPAHISFKNKARFALFLLMMSLLITQSMNATYSRFGTNDSAYRDAIKFAEEKIPRTAVVLTQDTVGNAIPQLYVDFFKIYSMEDVIRYNVTYAITIESYTYKPNFTYLSNFEQIKRFEGVWYNVTIYHLKTQNAKASLAFDFGKLGKGTLFAENASAVSNITKNRRWERWTIENC